MPSRRDLIQMTRDELRAYIRNQKTLIIVSNGPTGYPHPLPMNFDVDDEDRYYVTTFRKSQKVLNFRRDPKAALLIESGEAYSELRAVLAYATAEVIDDYDTTLNFMKQLQKKSIAAGHEVPGSDEILKATAAKRVLIRFTPHEFISWDHTKLGGKY